MADETLNKGPEGEKLPESPAPDGPGAPPAPEQAEQVTLPGMGEGGPAPSGKVINLSDVRGDDDKGGQGSPPLKRKSRKSAGAVRQRNSGAEVSKSGKDGQAPRRPPTQGGQGGPRRGSAVHARQSVPK